MICKISRADDSDLATSARGRGRDPPSVDARARAGGWADMNQRDIGDAIATDDSLFSKCRPHQVEYCSLQARVLIPGGFPIMNIKVIKHP